MLLVDPEWTLAARGKRFSGALIDYLNTSGYLAFTRQEGLRTLALIRLELDPVGEE
jgi:hypothetical protein